MTPAQRLLLVPLLAPLLAVLLLAGLNPAPRLSLQLLTWRSASLPLGAWLAMAASGGALFSAAAVGLGFGKAGRLSWSDRRRPDSGAAGSSDGPWREPEWDDRGAEPPRSRAPRPAERREASGVSAGPSRPIGEPAPTVAVPYRVIHRSSERDGAATVGHPSAGAAAAGWPQPPVGAPAPGTSGHWGDPLPEDW